MIVYFVFVASNFTSPGPYSHLSGTIFTKRESLLTQHIASFFPLAKLQVDLKFNGNVIKQEGN